MGRSKWSLCNVACAIHNGSLPGPADTNFTVILGVVYAVMLVDFIGLCFLVSFSVPKIQATIALIGLWLCGIAQYSHLGQKNWKLERLFYGRTSAGHVSLGYLVSELFVIMAALISVSLDAMLDTAPSARDAN